MDSAPTLYYSGYSATDEIQSVLYSTSGLAEGAHTLKLSNENARNIGQYPSFVYLDVDFVAVTGSLWVTFLVYYFVHPPLWLNILISGDY